MNDEELTKVTVKLIPKANSAMESLSTLLEMSRTDVINRALQIYELIELEKAAGHYIYIGDGRTGRRVWFDGDEDHPLNK